MLLSALSYDMRSPAVLSRNRSAGTFVALALRPNCCAVQTHHEH